MGPPGVVPLGVVSTVALSLFRISIYDLGIAKFSSWPSLPEFARVRIFSRFYFSEKNSEELRPARSSEREREKERERERERERGRERERKKDH